MIITKGFGLNQMIITKGYSTSERVIREVLRLVSPITKILGVISRI